MPFPKAEHLRIGNVEIRGDLILAPMMGYCDLPFRSLCRALGSAVSYIPCVLDQVAMHPSGRVQQLLDVDESERPLAIQVMGREPAQLVRACQHLLPLEPAFIDVNMGCPARRATSRGRGAALLREPGRVADIMNALSRALPVPVTAKIRLGWDDDSRNYLEIAHILQESGAAAIAVHGRTREQAYRGQADWQAIAQVCAHVSIPVLASGDVRTPGDIERVKEITGCSGVMIGRAAIGNPWIFARRDVSDISLVERADMMRRHLQAMAAYYGPQKGRILFRKHAVQYVRHMAHATNWRRALGSADTMRSLMLLIDTLASDPRQPPTHYGLEIRPKTGQLENSPASRISSRPSRHE